jgi:hypothetical protein
MQPLPHGAGLSGRHQKAINKPKIKKMKHTVLIWILSGIFLPAPAQNQKETRPVDDFTKVTFSAHGVVYITQGPVRKLELEGDPEVLARVQTTVRDGRLSIGEQDGRRNWRWKDNDEITVRITTPSIEELRVSGSGAIKAGGPWKTGNLKLAVSGSGSIEIETEGDNEVDAAVSGSGWLKVAGSAKSFQGAVSGSGRIIMNMNVYETAAMNISGSGRIEATGSAGITTMHVSGSGQVLALDFPSNKSQARISGSGDLELNVKHELDVKITGSGSVNYRGNPSLVHTRHVGSGKVRKVE